MERIFNKLIQLQSIVLTAHRGWGKSAISKEVGFRLITERKDFRVIYFDMQGIFEKSTFIISLIREVCKILSSNIPDQLADTTQPGFQILDQIESMASKQGVKLIIFISNFE